jgi:uncharacterized protein (DUF2147 family)
MKLNKILLFGFLFVLTCQVSLAQTVVGKWKTYDIFNRNKEESIVDIDIIDDILYIKIHQIIPEEHRSDLCTKCDDHRKNQPILGMTILQGATLIDGTWKGATILHAKNGNEYGCHISVVGPDLLKIRGFVGYPIFGKTLYWTRVKDNFFR